MDGVAEAGFDVLPLVGRIEFLFVPGGQVKGVHRGAFFGEDLGEENVEAEIRKGAADIVTDLYKAFMADPKLMRKHHWYDHISELPEAAKARQVGDYLAGMTDTYAIATHRQLFDHTPDLR